ncbi:DUF2834 domain-containing protein [Bacteriovoracaceae bacterium]|nr:DUF2834 domain-containing protein [Bacteriovoracaceae bacterium]
MRKKVNALYFVLGLLALIFCWYYNIQHIQIGGDLKLFVANNLINPASASIFFDISFLFVSISVWFYMEGKKLDIKLWWVYIITGLIIGISISFPLFLIHRNIKLKE